MKSPPPRKTCAYWKCRSKQVANRFELKRVGGGLLVQTPDINRINRADLKVVSKRQPTEQEWNDLLFVWNVAKYVKSNAIVFGKAVKPTASAHTK